ncbi:MAG: PQQ-dependent sugar dehydrogenase [Alkalispirochaetaceae bacterium]
MRTVVLTFLLFSLLGCLGFAQEEPVVGEAPQEVETEFVERPSGLSVEPWIEGLVVPWSLTFLSEERALVTERPGRVRLIEDGRLAEEPFLEVDAAAVGEGGLMGIEKHPEYPREPYIYLMYTYRRGSALLNRVERFVVDGGGAESDRVIIDELPGSRYHDGGRIKFGPDGMLYVTLGENFEASRAQDRSVLSGSILRVAPDGSIPEDNPFEDSPIWSYGHRNPQGLAWHPETGDLFASEHGPSGEFGLEGHDIVNVIEKGENYGWPREVGVGGLEEYKDPLIMWVPATPPAGMAFWNGALYLSTLRSEALMRIEVVREEGSYNVRSIEGLFAGERYDGVYGRLRAAVKGPDGALYVLTSNRDGRGDPREGDDKILRITPR